MVYLDSHAMYGYTVELAAIRCETGSATATFYILEKDEQGWGKPVDGMVDIPITTTKALPRASANRTVTSGDELRMTVFNSNNAVHLRGTVKIKRT